MSEPNGGLLCRTSPFLGVFLNDRSRAFNTRYWCTFSINHKSTIDIGRYRYIGNGRCGAWRYRVQPKNQKIAKVWVRILPQLAISEIPSWRNIVTNIETSGALTLNTYSMICIKMSMQRIHYLMLIFCDWKKDLRACVCFCENKFWRELRRCASSLNCGHNLSSFLPIE